MDSDRWTGTRLNSVSFPAGGTLRLYLWPRLKAKVLGRSVMQSFVDNKQTPPVLSDAAGQFVAKRQLGDVLDFGYGHVRVQFADQGAGG